ncbi:polyhomeotic-like protein 3 isoform X3 [Syngnathus scovelli]|uniref:polyhomeotic-like protein 3 isoform X3 n=1 Tax=Syngnathus scovelli TaxID=161590 RepID=UPI002110E444|nr:polyhomeotic-like protein 3 isoform X3 [Syngnathus scovelli]
MDKGAGGASQSDRGPASSSSSDSAAAGTPTPPRLTPNPMLLQDLPAPPQTPVTSSPPPPLTPAPSLSTPKMAAAARTSSPHVLVPAPPKLTTTASSALRGTTSSSSPSLSTTASSAKTSMVLTNGSARSVPVPTSNTITPFHTPASPPGRQVPQPHPAGSPGSARHRTSQQALLLGKGLKGSGQEQVLLRTQMVSNAGTPSGAVGRRLTVASSCLVSVCGAQLQSVTPRPPLPAALAAPPSLRLKPPASAPPPLSRPQTALFPPLRPRPPTAPCRHLSVPPPTLYSPVRAVPLRPKLQCVRALSPWVSAALQTQPPPAEIGVLPMTVPPLAASSSETPPSASRRLQIIALSSARPPQSVARPNLSRREALPLSQSVTSPPRRKDSEAPPAGLHDVHVTEKDQRRKDEDEPVKMEAKKEADLLERQQMEVTEEDHGDREQPMEVQEEGAAAAAEVPSPVARPQALKETATESNITETDLPEALPVRPPEACVRAIEAPELPADGTGQEEFCERITDDRSDIINESVSAHSDNHSALSSLSSQSPPSSPWTDPASHAAAQPLNLSRSQPAVENRRASETATEAEPPPDPSEDGPEDRATDRPWQTGPWPQGRDVLTHVVEGFVIQEGLQPFPVNRSSLLLLPQAAPPPPAQEVNGSKTAVTATEEATEHSDHSTDSQDEDGKDTQHGTRASHCERAVLHCQFCGKRGHAHNFMRSKRFCSTSCARGFNVRLTKRLRALSAGSRGDRPPRPVLNRAQSVPGKPLLLRLPRDLWSAGRREKDAKEDKKVVVATEEEHCQEDEEEEEDMEAAGEEEEQEDEGEEEPVAAVSTRMESPASERVRTSPAATPSTPTSTFKPEPSQWTVEDVTAFIHTLPGCGEVSSAFRLQEIDGQALLLLTEEHLMGSMNIKLGPALKICAHINALKNL